MRVTFTREQMLALWRRHVAAEPERTDFDMERTDGIDLDSRLEREMRCWYLQLLDNGREQWLAPVDLSVKAQVQPVGHIMAVKAPEGCRRVLAVKFAGWPVPVAVADRMPPEAANPYCRRRLAWRVSGREIAVTGATGDLARLECAWDSGQDEYTFDDSALCVN